MRRRYPAYRQPRGVILVNRQNGHNNRNVVSHILREERTNRTVYQTGGQNCLLGRTALSLDEGAGDFAYRIKFLFKIYREREEIKALTRFLGSGYIDHNGGIAEAYQNRAVCQTSHFAGFKRNLFAGKLCFKHSEIFKHFCSLLFMSRRRQGPIFSKKSNCTPFGLRFDLMLKQVSPPTGTAVLDIDV